MTHWVTVALFPTVFYYRLCFDVEEIQMANKFDPPVEIDLGTNPQRIKFNTVKQAEEWIQAEVVKWGPDLNENSIVKTNTPFLGRILDEQRNSLQKVVTAVDAAKNEPEMVFAPDEMIKALKVFETRRVLHSHSSSGQVALDLLLNASNVREFTVACGYLAAAIQFNTPIVDFTNRQFHQVDYTAYSSGIAAYWNRMGPGTEESTKAIDKHVKKTFSGWEEQLALHQNDHFDAVELIKDKKQKITEEHTRQETEFNALKKGYETKFSEFEEFYKEGLRTNAPVKYWASKATKHAYFGALMFTMFIGGCVVAAIYGFNLGSEFSDAIKDTSTAASAQAPQSESPNSILQLAFSKFLVLLVPGFFAVWVLRILLKVALSNLAIADDARHRVTMVETFLSLMEHTDKLDEADRILMLQALFRPIPGSNDDDTGPPNWFDIMMQQVKKK